jgi:hypothetical protein
MLRTVSKLLLPLLALAALAAPVRLAAQASQPAAAAVAAPSGAVLRGDVNGDGQVTVLDALAVIAYVVGKELPAEYQIFPNGDADGNGRITTMDALVITGYAMGRDVSRYPVATPIQGARTDGLLCVGSLRDLTVTCRSQQPQRAQLPAGAHGSVTYSGQNVYVRLTNSPAHYDNVSEELTFDVDVTNLIPQTLGVDSLGNVSPDGIRIVFNSRNPQTIQVLDSAGSADFLSPSSPYYQYPGGLADSATTAPKGWRLHVPNTSPNFSFVVYVNAEVKKPRGYVDVYPSTATLVPTQTQQLLDTVRTFAGTPTGQTVHWSSSDTLIAKVNTTTGLVTAVSDGTVTITARALPDTSASITHPSGTATITVASVSAAQSTITADSSTLTVGDTTILTVQVKRSNGANYTQSAGPVILHATSGTLLTDSAGSVVSDTATDNGNGTYTARLTNTVSGPVTVSGTLNGVAIGNTALVTFNPGGPANITKTAGDALADTVGTPLNPAPQVLVTDAHGNPVANVSVSFTAAAGNGTVVGSPKLTDATGHASPDSWTLSTVAKLDSLTATAGALTTVFVDTAKAGPATSMVKSAGDGQTATVGSAVATNPAVTITDTYGNPVSGVGVKFKVTGGGGKVANGGPAVDSVQATSDGSGVAAVTGWTLGNVVGANSLDASSPGLATVTFTATGTAAALDHFVVKAAGGTDIPNQLAGTPFNVQVTAKDVYENTVTSFNGSVTFSTTPATAGAITAGGTSGAFTNGVLSSHSITIGIADAYTLTATGGGKSGTSNSFEVQAPATAVDDAPAGNSVPGDPYHTAFNTTFNLAAPGIMSNDTRGFPHATVVTFGSDSLGGAITDHPISGSPVTVTPLPGHPSGSLTVGADGSIAFTPPTGFTGLYVFHYRIGNPRGTSDAQVTIAVGTRPAANNDTYSTALLGNVPISTGTSTLFSVATNDAGDAKVLAKVGQSNGLATLNADGTFTFLPDAGYTGPASFTYTVKNGFGTTAAATVSMTVTGIAWFVDTNAGAVGDGRLGTPFNNLSTAFAAATKPAANAPIFLYSSGTSYTGGVTLLAGQRLVGQGATGSSFASVMNVTWPSDAPAQPSIGGTSPTVVSGLTLGSGNTLQGFNLGGSGTALAGNGFGTLTVSQVGINTSGQALSLTNGTLSGGFTQVRSTGGTNNVFLSNVATSSPSALGTSADVLSGATTDAFVVSGGAGSFTYAGSITNTNTLAVNVSGKTGGAVLFPGDINPAAAARGISAANNSGGTAITFSGANQKISSGAAAGVNLTNNTGATVSFTGGNLVITTTSGNGFNATGGGTVIVDAPTTENSTISSSGGIALNVVSTTIGTGGLNFKSISASGGSNGIVLNGTGSNGLTVAGDGASDAANATRGRTTAKSGGGTIALGSGGTISGTTGTAVSLSSTGPVTLRNMVVQNGSGDGIAATTVPGLVLDNLRVTGKAFGHGLHGTSVSGLRIYHSDFDSNATDASTAGPDIWNVRLDDLAGVDSVASSLFHNGYEHIFVVKNTTATASFTATNSNFTDAGHGDGLDVYANGSSNITAVVQSDSLARNSSFGFDSGTQTTASGTLNVTLNNNQVINNFVGLDVAHGSSGTNTFNITNNNLQTNVASSSQAINVNRLADPTFTGFGLFSGTVSGNTIGTAGVANSGSDVGDGITVKTNGNGGTTRISILNNIIRSYGQHGIGISARDASTGHTLHARVQGNNIANGEAGLSLDGINVTMGALNTDVISMCLDIGGSGGSANTVTSAVRNGIRVRSSGLPAANVTLTLPSYDNSGATYFANRNPAATGAAANTSFSNASGTTSAGSCTTP